MLPQNCSNIHYPIPLDFSSNENKNIRDEKSSSLDICCFDYLINLEEYFSDNLMQNYFYFQFTKIVYDFDKRNIFDFQNYNKDSLFKFILILNKVCCYYYAQNKIQYSKFISNLSVRIIQNYFKTNISNNKKNSNFVNELKNNDIISNIYNNACCNYFKTLSYNKSQKFLEYSNKNIDENDINNKLIYFNNSLIISTKNNGNSNNNIENCIKAISNLITARKKYFDNIYFKNTGDSSLKIILKKNDENYNSFKLLAFIMYNYAFAVENLLNQKIQAKKYYQSSYEYVCKYLGKNSFESQKFLFKIKDNKNNIPNNYFSVSILRDNKIFYGGKKRKNSLFDNDRGENKISTQNYEDIDLTLNNIIKRIENFEEILKNKEILEILNKKNADINNNNINAYQEEEKKEKKFRDINPKKENNNINSDDLYIKEKNLKSNNDNLYDKNNKANNKNININTENNSNKDKKESDIIIKKEEKNNDENKENKKKINLKEKISFDMMDNIIEEFKKESQEKLEQQKKLKEEKEKEKKLKEEKEKIEKDKKPENLENKIKIEKVEDNNNQNDSKTKKPLRIKKLFQKVLGRTYEKEPPKTKLGELFQSLMKGPNEEKKIGMDQGGGEIKMGSETKNNFINLDDDED